MGKKRKRFVSHYNTYFEKIYRYIYFRTGQNRETAEDLTSEVMLKAYEAYEDFDESRNFGIWIYRIAKNHLIDHYKKAKREIVSLEDAANELKTDEKIAEKLDAKMKAKTVERALESLSEAHKEAVILRFFNGLSYVEIAGVTGLTEANARVMVSRATARLKKQLSFLT